MNGGATALHLSGDARRRVSIALGATSVVIAVLALITATRGPAAISSALPGATPAAPPKPVAAIAITSAGVTQLNPAVPVSVEVAHGTLQSVQVIDSKTGKPLAGEMAVGGASWHTTVGLSYADSYQVSATAVGSDGQVVHQTGTVATVKPALQAYPSFIPAPGQSTVGVGQPLVVKFDHPVSDKAAAERALKVTTSPEQTGSWYWISPSEVPPPARTTRACVTGPPRGGPPPGGSPAGRGPPHPPPTPVCGGGPGKG